MRSGREVLQPRSDGDDDVGFGSQFVGGGRSRDADGPGKQRVVPGQDALAGVRFTDRDAVLFDKGLKPCASPLAITLGL